MPHLVAEHPGAHQNQFGFLFPYLKNQISEDSFSGSDLTTLQSVGQTGDQSLWPVRADGADQKKIQGRDKGTGVVTFCWAANDGENDQYHFVVWAGSGIEDTTFCHYIIIAADLRVYSFWIRRG